MKYKSKNLFDIKKETCRIFDISPEWIDVKTKKGGIVEARQACHWAGYYMTTEPLDMVGHLMGKRDHATVIHSAKSINKMIKSDYTTACRVKLLMERLNEMGIEVVYPNGRGVSDMKIETSFKQAPTKTTIDVNHKIQPNLRQRLINERQRFLSLHDKLELKRRRIEKSTDLDVVINLAREISELEHALKHA